MLELFPKAISIYKWGSCILPFIKKPHDIDYLVIYRNEEDINSVTVPIQEDVDLHFFILSLDDFKSGRFLDLNNFKDEKRHYHLFKPINCAALYLIMFYWAELYEGEDLHMNQYFNIENHKEILEMLKKAVVNKAERLLFNLRVTNNVEKYWYYIALGFYIYLNKGYNLTKDQIDIINKFHDSEATDKDCFWLYNQIDTLFN